MEVGDTFAHARSESTAEGCREAASKEKLRNIVERSSDVLRARQGSEVCRTVLSGFEGVVFGSRDLRADEGIKAMSWTHEATTSLAFASTSGSQGSGRTILMGGRRHDGRDGERKTG